jgi:mannosyltransferase
MTVRGSDWLWLVGILGLALVLRAIKLDAGLWFDEIVTLVNYVRLPTRELLTTYTTFNNHILFSLEAQASIALLGESPWSLRLPALIFGVASVGALWWLARLVATPWEAHLSALLMAVSYHHVWFSQNARGYTGLLFWCLLGTIIFLSNMRRPSWWSWVAYALVLTAAVYTHLTAAFFFAAQGVVYIALVVAQRFGIRVGDKIGDDPLAEITGLKPLFGFALGGVLVLAVYAVLLPQMVGMFGSVVAPPAEKVAVAVWKSPDMDRARNRPQSASVRLCDECRTTGGLGACLYRRYQFL